MQRNNQFIYFKIQQTQQPLGTILLPEISACTVCFLFKKIFPLSQGVINIYVRVCNPQNQDCSVESNFIPSPQRFDYSSVFGTQNLFGQETLTKICGAACLASHIYFIGITASEPQDFQANIVVHVKLTIQSAKIPVLFGMERSIKQKDDLLIWNKIII